NARPDQRRHPRTGLRTPPPQRVLSTRGPTTGGLGLGDGVPHLIIDAKEHSNVALGAGLPTPPHPRPKVSRPGHWFRQPRPLRCPPSSHHPRNPPATPLPPGQWPSCFPRRARGRKRIISISRATRADWSN